MGDVELVSVNSMDRWIFSINAKPPFSTFLLWFIRPFLFTIMRFRYIKRLHFLKNEDIFYLFDNVTSDLVPSTRAFILGSNHGFI
jgi:hypothetical protein